MKRLTPLPIDDAVILRGLSRDATLATHPTLARDLTHYLACYTNYQNANGNPNVVSAMQRAVGLRAALIGLYSNPSPALKPHFDATRTKLSPDVCSMCGGFNPDTLDHFFPKDDYPEYTVFSKNLVPACRCNRNGRPLYNPATGDRALHPFFDDCLKHRLVRVSITGPDFRAPTIALQLCCGRRAERASIKFHMENVIQSKRVSTHLRNRWRRMRTKPWSVIQTLPRNFAGTAAALSPYIKDALDRTDNEFETPNNWRSMLLAGILARRAVLQWLATDISNLSRGLRNPED